MKTSPITNAEILKALTSGQFKPLTADDRLAFMDAGDDALLWFANDTVCVLVCTISDGSLVFEVYDNTDAETVWQGVSTLTPL